MTKIILAVMFICGMVYLCFGKRSWNREDERDPRRIYHDYID